MSGRECYIEKAGHTCPSNRKRSLGMDGYLFGVNTRQAASNFGTVKDGALTPDVLGRNTG